MTGLAGRLQEVEARIEAACRDAGRARSDVTLVAVSKTVPVEGLLAAYELGVRDFGESRLQEATPKVQALPSDVVWHFVGRLQSNKARKVAGLFSALHTIESESQLREIAKANRTIDALVEVNVAEEARKGGVFPEALDNAVAMVAHYPGVRFRGLMTIGPLSSDPELSRPVFRRLKELGERVGAEWLSMGMSQDLHVAIQEGATHVRVGTALFGERG